jgi:hypothetical protein
MWKLINDTSLILFLPLFSRHYTVIITIIYTKSSYWFVPLRLPQIRTGSKATENVIKSLLPMRALLLGKAETNAAFWNFYLQFSPKQCPKLDLLVR